MRKFSWILCVVILSVLGSNASAKIIDVVHLKNGSIIQGTITVINESIKIETDDGSTFIVEISEVDKIKKIEFINPKNTLVATGLGCGTIYLNFTLLPVIPTPIPISGVGQIYNGQYLKGLAFFGIGVLGSYLGEFGSDDAEWTFDDRIGELGVTLVLGSMLLSPIDAYYSAKRINSEAKKKLLSTTTSLNLNYIPHEGLMASYHFRF